MHEVFSMKFAFDRLKLAAKSLFQSLGLEVRLTKNANTEETVLRNLFRQIAPVAVLDVGANVGQYATMIRKLGFRGTIVSFEAIPAVHSTLSAAAALHENWLVAPCGALGSSKGKIQINLSKNSVSSSVLPMRSIHLLAAPESLVIGTQTVEMNRLDDISVTGLAGSGPLFLKIDTQGYEKEVLKGAVSLLRRIEAIQVELSLIDLYEGAPDIVEMISFIKGSGYDLFSIVPGFKDLRSGRLLQADGFFVRRTGENVG
jgi:FkbM family methyltransferase